MRLVTSLPVFILIFVGLPVGTFAQGGPFSGAWDCPGRGVMTLTQRGSEVNGSYDWNGGATVSGRVDGNRMLADWQQRDTRGSFDMTLSADGSTLSGTWSYTGRTGGGNWSCRRATDPPLPSTGRAGDVSGQWNCPGRGVMTLTQRGGQVSGSYDWNGGASVSGRMDGNRMVADWQQRNARGGFDMTLSADGSTLSGTWDYADRPGGGSWSCTRAGSPPPPPPPGGGGSPPVSSQQITCWDSRSRNWVTETLSCVSPAGHGGSGVCTDPRALAAMDEWLSGLGSGQTQWDCWGRWYPVSRDGSARRRCSMHVPDTDGRTRCEYLRDNVRGSVPGLGTLMEHVHRRLGGR